MIEMLIAFVVVNWVDIFVITIFILTGILLWKNGHKAKVYILLLEIVNEVEEKYGNDNQEIKYEIILGRVYPKLPKSVRWLISMEELDDMITKTIDDIQETLEKEK